MTQLRVRNATTGDVADASSTNPAPVTLSTTISGESQTLNRLFGGSMPLRTSQSTSAGATIKSGAGALYGYICTALGTTPTIDFYDNTTASGTKLVPQNTGSAVGNFPAIVVGSMVMLTHPIPFTTGLHCVIGGTGTTTFNILYI